METQPLRLRDWAIAGLIALFALAYALHRIDFAAVPYEDAAMLMRYAQNLAAGHGIVWNIGDPPLDGATDFLFLVSLAGLTRLTGDALTAARGLTLVAHLLTVVLLYLGICRLHGMRWAAVLSGAYLTVGPAVSYSEAGFGTSLFALCALAA